METEFKNSPRPGYAPHEWSPVTRADPECPAFPRGLRKRHAGTASHSGCPPDTDSREPSQALQRQMCAIEFRSQHKNLPVFLLHLVQNMSQRVIGRGTRLSTRHIIVDGAAHLGNAHRHALQDLRRLARRLLVVHRQARALATVSRFFDIETFARLCAHGAVCARREIALASLVAATTPALVGPAPRSRQSRRAAVDRAGKSAMGASRQAGPHAARASHRASPRRPAKPMTRQRDRARRAVYHP